MSLKICPYHMPGDGDKEIKKNQKECPDNPDQICSDAGFCYRYRSAISGHCDLPEWAKSKKKEEKEKEKEKPKTATGFQDFRLGGKRVKSKS